MKRVGILTSGGDSPGMNATIRALVRAGDYENFEMIGINRGYEGLIDGDFSQMDLRSVGGILHKGGTILKTSRSDRFRTEEGQNQAVENLSKSQIDALVVIGGEGSMKGAIELSKKGVTCIVLPGTIDNDMGYTDYTIGFDTAINTVLSGISNIRDTASSHGRATLVEVMGRRCGDLALYAGLAGGADAILIPEIPVDLNVICAKLKEGKDRGKTHSFIIKAEGVTAPNGEIEKAILEKVGQKTNTIVLSYLQRGGSPTAEDRLRGSLMAIRAIKSIEKEQGSLAVGICGNQIITMELEAASAITKEADLDKLAIMDMLSK